MVINFLTSGNISHISVLSDDDSHVYFDIPDHGQGDIEETYSGDSSDDDEQPLALLSGSNMLSDLSKVGEKALAKEQKPLPRTYRWHKKEILLGDVIFKGAIPELFETLPTPLSYFSKPFTHDMIQIIMNK